MACGDCDFSHAIAERLDAWNTAYSAMKNKKWGPEGEEAPLMMPMPGDVLLLALFLTNGHVEGVGE